MHNIKQKRCKRGHLLSETRFVTKANWSSTGIVSGCRLCKKMRNKLQSLRNDLKAVGKIEQAPTLDEFAREYFKGEI
jgi:hypothetical protein